MVITISIFSLKKHGYLNVYKKGVFTWEDKYSGKTCNFGVVVNITDQEQYMRLLYGLTDMNGETESFDYKVRLTTTECTYGGKRYWFVCPLRNCGKRIGTLYLGNKYFGCRHCYNITYSRNENRRHKFQWMVIQGRLEEKEEALELSILTKRRWYGAKPTKIQRKLNELFQKLYRHDRPFY